MSPFVWRGQKIPPKFWKFFQLFSHFLSLVLTAFLSVCCRLCSRCIWTGDFCFASSPYSHLCVAIGCSFFPLGTVTFCFCGQLTSAVFLHPCLRTWLNLADCFSTHSRVYSRDKVEVVACISVMQYHLSDVFAC